jgi:hypothetical protein
MQHIHNIKYLKQCNSIKTYTTEEEAQTQQIIDSRPNIDAEHAMGEHINRKGNAK